ncbi:MAG: hypothetical protein LBU55_02590 [Elusimicrobiota bacterium]|nr:hypothetical protein [Elusimicrobiota bacterium]
MISVFLFMYKAADAKSAPVLANAYNGFAASARSAAMGNAGAGLPAARISDFFYQNPAALAFSEGIEAQCSYKFSNTTHDNPKTLNDVSGNGFASAYIVNDLNSFSWQNLSYENIGIEDYKKETSIKSLSVSSGKQNSAGVGIGVNLSYLYGWTAQSGLDSCKNPYSNISSGNGFSFDLAFLFPFGENLALGINLKNVLGFMFWTDYDYQQLPFSIKAGLGYCNKTFSLAFDWDKRFYRFGNLDDDFFYLGLEQYVIDDVFCLRAGTQTADFDKNKSVYTYGAGIKLKKVTFAFSVCENQIFNEKTTTYLISVASAIS